MINDDDNNFSFKIVYIDDHVDESLSEYLDKYSKSHQEGVRTGIVHKEYKEISFGEGDTYEKLLTNCDVRYANIIIIDNYLFEECTARDKFTGRQFKLILQEVFPFIQVLVITQDQSLTGRNIIHKYNIQEAKDDVNAYYRKELESRLNDAISDILEFRNESEKFLKDSGKEGGILPELIQNSLMGNTDYKNLTKDDIDDLVKAFKEMREHVHNCG